MQRDDDMDIPVKHREPSLFFAENLAKAEARYAELSVMTIEQAAVAARAEYDKLAVAECRYEAERIATKERYTAMLDKVRAWKPPTAAHSGLRTFMEEQLLESIRFDCSGSYREPELKAPLQWLDDAKSAAYADIGRAGKDVAEENARCSGANLWIDALYESLSSQP